MSSTIGDIRTALQSALETSGQTNLVTYAVEPDDAAPPCAIVFLDEPPIDYDFSMNNGFNMYHFVVLVLAQRVSVESAQNALDGFMSATGTGTVRGALYADRTLGGKASDVHLKNATGYGSYDVAGVTYLGVKFHVDVLV